MVCLIKIPIVKYIGTNIIWKESQSTQFEIHTFKVNSKLLYVEEPNKLKALNTILKKLGIKHYIWMDETENKQENNQDTICIRP